MIPCKDCLVFTQCKQVFVLRRSIVITLERSKCPYLVEYIVKSGYRHYKTKINIARSLFGLDEVTCKPNGYDILSGIYERIKSDTL